MRGREMESVKLLGDSPNKPKKRKLGRNGELFHSVSLRPLPRPSVDVRDAFGRKMGDGELLGASHKNPYMGETRCGLRNYSTRHLPWTSAMCGRRIEAGDY